jgi:hypothetical protein
MDLTGAQWRKASRSASNGGECVELASASGVVAIRDSKDPAGPMLLVDGAEFRSLAKAIKDV